MRTKFEELLHIGDLQRAPDRTAWKEHLEEFKEIINLLGEVHNKLLKFDYDFKYFDLAEESKYDYDDAQKRIAQSYNLLLKVYEYNNIIMKK
jgi:hypothetical protein